MSDKVMRPVTNMDDALLSRMHGESFGDSAWNIQQFKGGLHEPSTQGWIVDVHEKPAGFLLCKVLPGDEAEILTFCVVPTMRRHKVGSMLLEHALSVAYEAKCVKVLLDVAADNVAACTLYKNLGFQLIGTRRNYYRQGRESAVDAQTYELTL